MPRSRESVNATETFARTGRPSPIPARACGGGWMRVLDSLVPAIGVCPITGAGRFVLAGDGPARSRRRIETSLFAPLRQLVAPCVSRGRSRPGMLPGSRCCNIRPYADRLLPCRPVAASLHTSAPAGDGHRAIGIRLGIRSSGPVTVATRPGREFPGPIEVHQKRGVGRSHEEHYNA